MVPVDVVTAAQAEDLAARILMLRNLPLVLVSTSVNGDLLFDIDELSRELDGIADVVTITTGNASHRLEYLLPPKTQVFGGAGRSYPPDFGADPAWSRSHLRFPGQSDAAELINDAMAQTRRRTIESAPTPSIRRATGIVLGFIADSTRAMVRLDDGRMVTASAALLPVDISLMAALVVGEPVTGILDDLELQPEPAVPDLDQFIDGNTTLALVTKVTSLRATVQLHPRAPQVLRRRDVSLEELPVDEVLHVGDVIRVRVNRSARGELAFSHTDAEDDAPLVESVPLVLGGQPWLAEGRVMADDSAPEQMADGRATEQTADATVQAPAPLASAPTAANANSLATRDDITSLSREITMLRGDLLALTNLVARASGVSPADTAELTRLHSENAQLRAKLADERAERAGAEARLSQAAQDRRDSGRARRDAQRAGDRVRGAKPTTDSIRSDIERVWSERTAPGERDQWPLRTYRLRHDFVESIIALDEGQQAKAIRTCVDAITGRDREIAARDLHRLRSGEGGDDPFVVREDGARAWRSAVEQNTPGARRLHYWELRGGVIELSRVVHHDDTRP